MQQLEIQFFWPLTEQIPLDLDYTDCATPKLWTTMPIVGGTGLTLAGSTGTFSWSQRIGDWEIQNQNETPSRFKKLMTKYLLGWKWMGK